MTKFGDVLTVKVNPALIMDLSDYLADWIVELSDKETINVERETIAKAQQIISRLASLGETTHDTE